jgi:hypothetical protein
MKYVRGKFAIFCVIALLSFNFTCFANFNPHSMRVHSAVLLNTKLTKSINLVRDENGDIISYYVNGIPPKDVQILLTKSASPLSTEYTIITGITKEGASCCFMLPSAIANPYTTEIISLDLVNGGAVNVQIATQSTGQPNVKR